MKIVFTIVQVLVLLAALALSCWTLEEATKRTSPDWIGYLYIWDAVLWLLLVLSMVFRKKILRMSIGTACLTTLSGLCVGGAVIDTLYAVGLVLGSYPLNGKINQSLLCLALWAASACLIFFAVRLHRHRRTP